MPRVADDRWEERPTGRPRDGLRRRFALPWAPTMALLGLTTAWIPLFGGACTAGTGETNETGETSASDGDTSSTGDSLPPPPMADESCMFAPIVDPGRISGSLRDVEAGAGVCGVAGPTTYLQVAPELDVDVTVIANATGFAPRLGIAPGGCIAGREFACVGGETLELRDVAAGTVLTLEIGAAATDPGLAAPVPVDGLVDPLAFTVDVGFRRILDVGERCLPESRGRCPGGTLCAAPASADPADLAAWVCAPLAGDTCATAELLVIDGASGDFVVDRGAPQTDAHAHACTGGGLLERVFRLKIDAPLPPGASLVVGAKAAVGLAARGPGCAAAAEIACVEAEAGGTLTIEDLEGLAAADADPYLFVEWPAAEGAAEEPVSLTWTILGD